jgi:hypothetical protein
MLSGMETIFITKQFTPSALKSYLSNQISVTKKIAKGNHKNKA